MKNIIKIEADKVKGIKRYKGKRKNEDIDNIKNKEKEWEKKL